MWNELLIKRVKVIYEKKIQDLCVLPYPDHKGGCPNYGKKDACPPECSLINEIMNIEKPIYLIALPFDLEKQARKMKMKHPDWTERQCRNLLYWQSSLKKRLKQEALKFINDRNLIFDMTPEAHGVNLTKMAIKAGIDLAWKRPLKKVWQIALVGEAL